MERTEVRPPLQRRSPPPSSYTAARDASVHDGGGGWKKEKGNTLLRDFEGQGRTTTTIYNIIFLTTRPEFLPYYGRLDCRLQTIEFLVNFGLEFTNYGCSSCNFLGRPLQ